MKCLSAAAAAVVATVLTGVLTGCSSFDFFVANAPNVLDSVQRTSNISYGDAAWQHLDIYVPRNADHRPVVVFFYGGSWTVGRKADYGFVGTALAERGYVTVIPDYGHFPQVRFPGFIEDGALAVAWVRQHARNFGGDPDRLVLMGHSAGAHIAALLALNHAYLEKVGVPAQSVVALVGLSGPYALVPDTDTLRTIFSSPYTPADWQPVHFASARSPPALLLHGLDDHIVYPSHSVNLRDALLSHGADVETHFYPKRGHADTIASFAFVTRFRTPALRQTTDFLDRVTAARIPAISGK